MTPQVTELQQRIDACRSRWEPIFEDSIGVIYGGYRDHDSHCAACRPLIAAIKRIATLEAALVSLTTVNPTTKGECHKGHGRASWRITGRKGWCLACDRERKKRAYRKGKGII